MSEKGAHREREDEITPSAARAHPHLGGRALALVKSRQRRSVRRCKRVKRVTREESHGRSRARASFPSGLVKQANSLSLPCGHRTELSRGKELNFSSSFSLRLFFPVSFFLSDAGAGVLFLLRVFNRLFDLISPRRGDVEVSG